MFSIFKTKLPIEKLTMEYQKLMAEAHKLSTVSRSASDAKVKEANDVQAKIDELLKMKK